MNNKTKDEVKNMAHKVVDAVFKGLNDSVDGDVVDEEEMCVFFSRLGATFLATPPINANFQIVSRDQNDATVANIAAFTDEWLERLQKARNLVVYGKSS